MCRRGLIVLVLFFFLMGPARKVSSQELMFQMEMSQTFPREAQVKMRASQLQAGASRIPTRERQTQTVKIGLLLPGNQVHAEVAAAVRNAAELAVADANANGGYTGRPFELIVRTVQGAWGAGSSEIVRLVFDEPVWAVLGGIGGREAHLIEQIVTKRRVVFVTPWASDPTLTGAYVPWMFRVVPDDRRQAEMLLRTIPADARMATVRDKTSDAKAAEAVFADEAAKRGRSIEHRLLVKHAVSTIRRTPINAVVLFSSHQAAEGFVRELAATDVRPSLFGPVSLSDPSFSAVAREGGFLFTTFRIPETKTYVSFRKRYSERFGRQPHVAAGYSYDGTRAVIEAIRSGGLDHDKIRKALAKIDGDGVTGRVVFDDHGNRLGDARVDRTPVPTPRHHPD
ncbi:MAG: ABC transporter substrate-binding protein [Rhodothermales bacterium]